MTIPFTYNYRLKRIRHPVVMAPLHELQKLDILYNLRFIAIVVGNRRRGYR